MKTTSVLKAILLSSTLLLVCPFVGFGQLPTGILNPLKPKDTTYVDGGDTIKIVKGVKSVFPLKPYPWQNESRQSETQYRSQVQSAAAASTVTTVSCYGPNLITNPSFSDLRKCVTANNSNGFSTDLQFYGPVNCDYLTGGYYNLYNNKHSCVDHTADNGNYMFADFKLAAQAPATPVRIWSQEINVQSGKTYYFDMYALDIHRGRKQKPVMQLKINGVAIPYTGAMVDLTVDGGWQRYYGITWTCPSGIQKAKIEMIQRSFYTSNDGNDLALDDLFFAEFKRDTVDADFTYEILSNCNSVKFNQVEPNKSTHQYAWNFGLNSSPATANSYGPHLVYYSAGGTKTIVLNITNQCATTQSVSKDVSLPIADPNFNANFTFDDSKMYCPDYPVAFTSAYTDGVHNWTMLESQSINTFSASGPNPDISFPNAKTYTITHSVNKGGCICVPVSKNITINAKPNPAFTYSSSNGAPYCMYEQICFSPVVTASNITHYWNIYDYKYETAQTAPCYSLVTGSTGSKQVIHTVDYTNGTGCANSQTQQVLISDDEVCCD